MDKNLLYNLNNNILYEHHSSPNISNPDYYIKALNEYYDISNYNYSFAINSYKDFILKESFAEFDSLVNYSLDRTITNLGNLYNKYKAFATYNNINNSTLTESISTNISYKDQFPYCNITEGFRLDYENSVIEYLNEFNNPSSVPNTIYYELVDAINNSRHNKVSVLGFNPYNSISELNETIKAIHVFYSTILENTSSIIYNKNDIIHEKFDVIKLNDNSNTNRLKNIMNKHEKIRFKNPEDELSYINKTLPKLKKQRDKLQSTYDDFVSKPKDKQISDIESYNIIYGIATVGIAYVFGGPFAMTSTLLSNVDNFTRNPDDLKRLAVKGLREYNKNISILEARKSKLEKKSKRLGGK